MVCLSKGAYEAMEDVGLVQHVDVEGPEEVEVEVEVEDAAVSAVCSSFALDFFFLFRSQL